MQKKHVTPEFLVIRQDEANAKFFVASFTSFTWKSPTTGAEPERTTSTEATTYEGNKDGNEIDLDDVFK